MIAKRHKKGRPLSVKKMTNELYKMLYGEKLAKHKEELRQIQIADKMTEPLLKETTEFSFYKSRLVLTPHNIRFIPSGSYSRELLKSVASIKKEIRDFSVKSRRNFMSKLDCSDFQGRLFITLTYPRNCVPTLQLHDFSGVSAGKNRKVFPVLKPCDVAFSQCKAFIRAADRLTYQFRHGRRPLWFWKREFQKDGTIHFHLLTDLIPDALRYTHSQWFYKGKGRKGYYKKARQKSFSWELLPVDFIQQLQNLWSHIIGERCNGKNNSMDIAPVRSQNGSIFYMCKYLDKKTECTECPHDCINLGRYWGIQNRKEYRRIEPIILELPNDSAFKVRAFLHYNLDSKNFNWKYILKTKGYTKEEWYKPVENFNFQNAFCSFLIDNDIFLRRWSHSVFNNYSDL